VNFQKRQIQSGSASSHRRPRVLLVVESAAAGTGRHVMDLASGLSARGCDVHVIHSSRRVDQPFLDRLDSLPEVRRASLPMRTAIHPADLFAVRAVRRFVRQHGPFDIIHGHSSKGGAIARLASIGNGAHAIYTIHGMTAADPGLSRLKRWLYTSIELLLSRFTSRIIAVSPEEQRIAIRMGFGEERTILIPNGIAPAPEADRNSIRRSLGLSDENVAIGFVGRLVEQKSPDVLVDAFARTVAVAPTARLVMIGDGPLMQPLQAQAKRLGVSEKVLWLGERNALPLYAAFDLFAIASRKEGLPYVVLESLAAGLPVVATETAGVESLVETNVNGAVVPLGDVAGFAEGLTRIVCDADLRRHMGEASLNRSRHFTIDRMVNQTFAAYQDVLRPVEAVDDEAILATEGDVS